MLGEVVHCFDLLMLRPFENHFEENHCLSVFLILIECFFQLLINFPVFNIFARKGNRNRDSLCKWV